MSLLSTTSRNRTRGLRLRVAIMLLCYVMGNLQLSLFHQFIHAHSHTISHTEANEADACHRAVYHYDGQRSCGHHSHIVVADKCELCDSISHGDQVFLSGTESTDLELLLIDFTMRSQEALAYIDHSGVPSRAPPLI